jgi:hypothetical protein
LPRDKGDIPDYLRESIEIFSIFRRRKESTKHKARSGDKGDKGTSLILSEAAKQRKQRGHPHIL